MGQTAPSEALTRFYDRFWSPAGAALRSQHDTHTVLMPARAWLWDGFGLLEGVRILEVGAGDGATARELALRGAAVTALDLSPVAVERIRSGAGQTALGPGTLDATVGDAEAMPFPDARFDVVAATKLSMHVDRARFLAEARRVLRPSGRLLLLEPMAGNPLLSLRRRLDRSFAGLPCVYPAWDDFAALPGFALLRRRAFFLIGSLSPRSAALRALDFRVLSRWPGLGRFAWIGAVDAVRA